VGEIVNRHFKNRRQHKKLPAKPSRQASEQNQRDRKNRSTDQGGDHLNQQQARQNEANTQKKESRRLSFHQPISFNDIRRAGDIKLPGRVMNEVYRSECPAARPDLVLISNGT
jgi:FtsZ-interacting cell division protein YlmF